MLISSPSNLNNLKYIAGIDEVGRGCVSGPVFAAAVILPKEFKSELIKDSKKLTDKKKKLAYDLIKENAIDISYSMVSAKEIDKINIQQATFLAMNNAIDKLKIKPEHLLVDGNLFESNSNIPYTCVIKGDNTYLSIAAASIVAKVLRDQYMIDLHNLYPQYKWDSNKGYGSKYHMEKISEIGVTEEHRITFLKNVLIND
jgi:ribonuclease HII